MEHHWKKPSGHVKNLWVFSMMFHDKILLYIIYVFYSHFLLQLRCKKKTIIWDRIFLHQQQQQPSGEMMPHPSAVHGCRKGKQSSPMGYRNCVGIGKEICLERIIIKYYRAILRVTETLEVKSVDFFVK